jgi:hypothetical protein
MQKIEAPANIIKDTTTFHLNTQLTTGLVQNGDYKSQVRFDLKNYINLDDDDVLWATVSLPSCVITNSNYIVNEYNNTMAFYYGTFLSPVTYITTIPVGNYTRASWITYMNSTASSPIRSDYFTVTSDNTTNKFTITPTALFYSTYPSGGWGMKSSTTCDYIWGFRTSFVGTALPSYTMTRCFNFLPIARFVFHCNILNSGLTLTTNSNIASTDVLAVIPNSSKLNSQIIYENNNSEFLIKSNSHISSITISITDDDNRLINFNGISCYFDLQFNLFRKSIQKQIKFANLVKQASETIGMYPENVIIEE